MLSTFVNAAALPVPAAHSANAAPYNAGWHSPAAYASRSAVTALHCTLAVLANLPPNTKGAAAATYALHHAAALAHTAVTPAQYSAAAKAFTIARRAMVVALQYPPAPHSRASIALLSCRNAAQALRGVHRPAA